MIWRKLLATAAVVVMAGGPALAAPKTMQLTAQTTVVNGKETITFESVTRVKDAKLRVETKGAVKMPDGQAMNSVMIIDPASQAMYMLNDKTKQAMKVKLDQAAAQMNLGTGLSADPAKIRAELQKQGGKVIGRETLLGHQTEIWSVDYQSPAKETSTAKVWLAKDLNMPLKVEVTTKGKGQTMALKVTDVKTNLALADSLFQVPQGYRVMDMADMTKRLQEMQKQQPAQK